jgi:hypothetical protein
VEWTLREWWFVKIVSAFAAFFAILFLVKPEHVTVKIEDGKKFGLFKPWTMKWWKEAFAELVDFVAYIAGLFFTRYLRKYGENSR